LSHFGAITVSRFNIMQRIAMTPPNILIVEDELLVAADIEQQLTLLGHHVCGVASSAVSAYQHAASVQPDLVLMDIHLKGSIDGIQAAKHLRELYQVPIVFLTAHADQDTLKQAVSAESFGYVTKPFNSRALAAAVEIALHRHRTETKISQTERRASLTLQCIGDGVITTDHAARINFMNPVAESITGWKAAEALGKSLEVVFNVCSIAAGLGVIDLLESAYINSAGNRIESAFALTRRDGSVVRIDNSFAPIREAEQKVVGVVVVFRELIAD
jgi:two-component system, cell cycle sensor histidine kinase and response regulator CckA